MQNGCQFHIKFHEESKDELYFNPRSWNRMKIFQSYIVRYEVILQVKLSYFSLLKDN